MRGVRILAVSVAALTISLAVSAQAFAVHDPLCDQYGNQVGVFNLNLNTPTTLAAGNVSDVSGSASACGSEAVPGGNVGDGTLYKRADILVPPGVVIANSDTVPVGSYAGIALVRILGRTVVGGAVMIPNAPIPDPNNPPAVPAGVATDNKSECAREGNLQVGDVDSCLKAATPGVGYNWNWSTHDAQGRSTLTVGEMHADVGQPFTSLGLTYVKLNLCGYFGSAPGTSCGTSGQFQQKNGNGVAGRCDSNGCTPPCGAPLTPGANGVYTVTATMADSTRTPAALACIPWQYQITQAGPPIRIPPCRPWAPTCRRR